MTDPMEVPGVEPVAVDVMDAADETDAVGPPTATPVVIQRIRRAPFNAPIPGSGVDLPVVIGRNWAAPQTDRKSSGLGRNRVIAGDLPDWAPLPPGELQIKRSAGASA